MKQSRPLWRVIQRLVYRHETKIRFVISGAVNTAMGLGIFPVLYLMLGPTQVHYVFILLLANFICIGCAFLLNKFFVFRTAGNYRRELGRFILFHITTSLLAVPALVEIAGISPIVAQPFYAVAIMTLSYFWHYYITFKTDLKAESADLSLRES